MPIHGRWGSRISSALHNGKTNSVQRKKSACGLRRSCYVAFRSGSTTGAVRRWHGSRFPTAPVYNHDYEILPKLRLRGLRTHRVYAIDALRLLPVGFETSADEERDGRGNFGAGNGRRGASRCGFARATSATGSSVFGVTYLSYSGNL